MTYYQLFKLSDFLSINHAFTTYVEIKEETSFKDAFGDFPLAMFNDTKVKGLYIVIFPEDAEDRESIYKGILEYCKDIEYCCSMFMGTDKDGFDKIIIGVDETK